MQLLIALSEKCIHLSESLSPKMRISCSVLFILVTASYWISRVFVFLDMLKVYYRFVSSQVIFGHDIEILSHLLIRNYMVRSVQVRILRGLEALANLLMYSSSGGNCRGLCDVLILALIALFVNILFFPEN